jgi:hypothetical protein
LKGVGQRQEMHGNKQVAPSRRHLLVSMHFLAVSYAFQRPVFWLPASSCCFIGSLPNGRTRGLLFGNGVSGVCHVEWILE